MMLYGDWAPGPLRCETRLPGQCALVNLEGPILPTDHAVAAAPKAGPSLCSTTLPRTDGLLLCSLANNHLMDYGAAGLATTRAALDECGGVGVGAGDTQAAARQPAFVKDRGLTVGIIACCEAQFGVAEVERAGVAAVGPWVYDTVRACRARADAVVVSMHAGAELSPWPAPALQDLYRSWIDAGATAIHGHHPHVPQGIEEYRDGLILYGPGNLAVDPAAWRTHPNALWSLAVDVDLAARPPRWSVQPYAVSGEGEHLELRPTDLAEHRAYWQDCHRPLTDRRLLEGLWQEVALRAYEAYYRSWLRFPHERGAASPETSAAAWRRWCAGMNRAGRPPKASRQDLRLWYHLFACATHHDSIATAIGVLSGELTDLRTPETATLVDRRMSWTRPQPVLAEAPA